MPTTYVQDTEATGHVKRRARFRARLASLLRSLANRIEGPQRLTRFTIEPLSITMPPRIKDVGSRLQASGWGPCWCDNDHTTGGHWHQEATT